MPAKQFEVKAKEHSATGGSALNTGVTVVKGERLIIKAAEDDTWACGAAADLTSNANGLVAGNKYGGVYGNMLSQTSGALLPYGSLVGSLDGGKSHFLVGTQYDAPVQQAGPIRSLSQSLSTAAAICAALRGNRLSSRWPRHSRTLLLQPI